MVLLTNQKYNLSDLSKILQNSYLKQQQQYRKWAQIYNHPILGQVSRTPFNDRYVLSHEFILENQQLFHQWKRDIQKITQDELCRQGLFLPVKYSFTQTSYCGSGGVALLLYEQYPYSLHPQIQNRKNIKRPFNQQQLLYLFFTLIKLAVRLETIGKIDFSIRPETILVNQDGYVKVVTNLSWPPHIHSNMFWQKQRGFIPPEYWEQRREIRRQNNPKYTMFTIGMTMLEAGTLLQSSKLYNINGLDQKKIQQHLQIFESRYSKMFTKIISQTLQSSPRKRTQPQKILNILQPYEHFILNLQQFQFENNQIYIPHVERQQKISMKKISQSRNKINQRNYYQNGYPQNINQSFQYRPNQQYRLVNQYSNFNPPQINTPSLSHSPSFNMQRGMIHSLPLQLQHSTQSNHYRPTYLAQQSMYVYNNSNAK